MAFPFPFLLNEPKIKINKKLSVILSVIAFFFVINKKKRKTKEKL